MAAILTRSSRQRNHNSQLHQGTQFLLIGTIEIRAVSLRRIMPRIVFLLIEIVCPVNKKAQNEITFL